MHLGLRGTHAAAKPTHKSKWNPHLHVNAFVQELHLLRLGQHLWVGCRQVDLFMLPRGHRQVSDHVPRRNETSPISKILYVLLYMQWACWGAKRLPLTDSYFTEVIACLWLGCLLKHMWGPAGALTAWEMVPRCTEPPPLSLSLSLPLPAKAKYEHGKGRLQHITSHPSHTAPVCVSFCACNITRCSEASRRERHV